MWHNIQFIYLLLIFNQHHIIIIDVKNGAVCYCVKCATKGKCLCQKTGATQYYHGYDFQAKVMQSKSNLSVGCLIKHIIP